MCICMVWGWVGWVDVGGCGVGGGFKLHALVSTVAKETNRPLVRIEFGEVPPLTPQKPFCG